jgi:hypothetical protein
MSGAADQSVLAGGRIGIERLRATTRLEVAILAGSGRGVRLRENRVGAEVLPSWWIGRGRVGAGLGLAVGGGAGIERDDTGVGRWSGVGWASPTALGELWLDTHLALELSAQLPITLLRRDDRLTVAALPAGWLGLTWRR